MWHGAQLQHRKSPDEAIAVAGNRLDSPGEPDRGNSPSAARYVGKQVSGKLGDETEVESAEYQNNQGALGWECHQKHRERMCGIVLKFADRGGSRCARKIALQLVKSSAMQAEIKGCGITASDSGRTSSKMGLDYGNLKKAVDGDGHKVQHNGA